jgi:hypothetical protein
MLAIFLGDQHGDADDRHPDPARKRPLIGDLRTMRPSSALGTIISA